MTVKELSIKSLESLKSTSQTVIIYIPTFLYPIQKRLIDLLLGILILLFFSIPMLFIALLIKFSVKGPVLYKQSRVGKDGEIFKIYKFRTMNCLENDSEFKQAHSDDPRIFKLGLLLRKTSLDELPNLFNVIKGEMSLVGPRPHAVKMDNELCNLSNDYVKRQKVKPGITGLAQISGYRGQTDTLDKILGRIRYDIKYIEECSALLDFKILFLTIGAVILEALSQASKV